MCRATGGGLKVRGAEANGCSGRVRGIQSRRDTELGGYKARGIPSQGDTESKGYRVREMQSPGVAKS